MSRMKYYLRNKGKIKRHYSEEYLNRMTRSLDDYFKDKTHPQIDEEWTGEPYPVFLISDIGHSVNMFAFYVIERQSHGAYKLAFKEVIG